ncbi:ribulokinase [uncultured Bacteroides sp.]|uniref:ribulokinase n=1 Tax=uncultured Bacteroides sp. TaxID=162156 RepID=UPI00262EEE8E|nr:ribulokinase [uncultured Bacteroides sp.]
MKDCKYVIGLDFGTDSCRALVVDASNGDERATGICYYPRWKAGLFCDAQQNCYRQHPLDYIEAMIESIRSALSQLTMMEQNSIKGICIDTTGSTPVLTDINGTPLALLPEFADDPDAMFILWKDHTAVQEAEAINSLIKEQGLDYLKYEGGVYSSEWVWAKVLHVIKSNLKIKNVAYSWVEHCDWMTGLLTGNTIPEKILRSRCAAGHKAMWNEQWGLPSKEFLSMLHQSLAEMLPHLFVQTYTSDTKAGTLTAEWASKLGLSEGIAVAVGALDAHMGAVGASIAPKVLVRIMGTSTCDIMVANQGEIGESCIEGICGQVDGSVLPGFIGFEAGQSAFGDIYAWFKKLLAWPFHDILVSENKQQILDDMLVLLTKEAQIIEPSVNDVVALDWMNGRRTPYADQNVKGVIAGLTLGSTASEVFKALVEATAFGSRRIVEHVRSQGLCIESINAIGGISKKAPYIMQVLANVLNMPIRVIRSEQACALGSAMFAAVAAGIYKDVNEAICNMGSAVETEYIPELKRVEVYNIIYEKYLEIANSNVPLL